MCLRGLMVLFLGLMFLLPVASLPSLAPLSSIMPIVCASLPAAHVKHSPLEKPALGSAARRVVLAGRVFTQVKAQVKNTTLSLGGNGNAVIGTTSPTTKLQIVAASNNNFDGLIFQPNNLSQSMSIGWAGIESSSQILLTPGNGSAGGVLIGPTAGFPLNKLVVLGNASVGADYNSAAPTNGLLVEGNVGHSDNRPGFRDAQLGRSSREKVVAHDGPRTSENGRRNPVIERRLTLTRSLFDYRLSAFPLSAGLFLRAS